MHEDTNSNSSAQHAILKCSGKKLNQLKDPCLIKKKKKTETVSIEHKEFSQLASTSINLQPSRSQQNSLEKTNEVPTSLVNIIWKLVKQNNVQQINFAAPPIQKLTKYLYFVGFLILKSKATAVFGEKFGLTIFHLQSWSLILRYSDPVSFIFM